MRMDPNHEEGGRREIEHIAATFEAMDGELAVLKQSIYELKKAAGNAELDPGYAELMTELEAISKEIDDLPEKLRRKIEET